MAKKTTKQQSMSPEKYIRTKARSLPIYKCYVGDNEGNSREKAVLVIRQHAGGTFTYGGYLLDCWCVGVKDTFWDFSVRDYELDDLVSRFEKHMNLREVSYEEAHNWVYGAADWATNAGIEPCKDFALTQYILQPDDDEVELIEYDFGLDGEYVLEAKDQQEANKYIPALKRTLGEGNFKVIISPLYGEPFENYDDEDEEDDLTVDDLLERMRTFGEKMKGTQDMEYVYKGGDYPKEITLSYPLIEPILRADTREMENSDLMAVMSLPKEALRSDLHKLILQEMGKQYGASREKLNEDDTFNWALIGNCMMVLADVGTKEESLPVVLEVMRQNQYVLDFNFGDMSNLFVTPVLWNLCKDEPELLLPFLLEEGLSSWGKNDVIVVLHTIGEHYKPARKKVIAVLKELLQEYIKDLPARKICDGSVVAFVVTAAVSMGAKELLPLIEEAYATDLVDKMICGDITSIREDIEHPYNMTNEPPHNAMEILKEYKKAFHK